MKTLQVFRAYWLLKLHMKDCDSYFGSLAPFGEHEGVLEEMMFKLRTEEVGQQMGVTFLFCFSL